MAYITLAELSTHLGTDTIEAISDGNDALLQAAIDAAYVEVKSYLSAFDIAGEFAKTTTARNALLIVFVKDIAVWHFINICNVNTDMKLRAKRYDDAQNWLKACQKGDRSPDIPKAAGSDTTSNDTVSWGSNEKREMHF